MKLLIRILAVPLVLLSLWGFVWEPYQCNLRTKRVRLLTQRALEAAPDNGAIQARGNLASLRGCMKSSAHDVDLLMIAAVNERILGRHQSAEQLYLRALQWDRRPELYLNLGSVQLEQGKRKEAIRNLFLAARFERALMYDGSIPASAVLEIQQRVAAEERHILESSRSR